MVYKQYSTLNIQCSLGKWGALVSLFFIVNLLLVNTRVYAQITPTAQTLSTTTPLLSCSETGSVNLSDSQGGILYTIQGGGTVWGAQTAGTGSSINFPLNTHSANRTLAGYANLTSVRFDGTNDYIETNGAVIPSSGDFTVSVWAREDASIDGLKEMLSQGTGGNAFYMGYNGEADNFRFGDTWQGTSTPYHNDSNWHHYAIVKTSTNTHFYLDGVLKESLGSAIANPAATNLRIARQYGPFLEYWDGNISHVLVANTAFSLAEVQNAMNLEYTGAESNVVAYYKLDENTGTSVSGTKAGSATGTLYNGPTWERTTTKVTNDVVITTDAEATVAYNWYQSTGDNLACYTYTYGKGTEADPMELENIGEVQLIDSHPTLHYQLTNNINAAGTRSWNSGAGFDPISNFSGSLDGNGYIIDSLYINRSTTSALFGRIESAVTIQKLGLSNIVIIGDAALAGMVYFLDHPDAILSNVFVTGTITGSSNMAGLVEAHLQGTIENSYVSVKINKEVSGSDPDLFIGGLVARTFSGSIVTNSFWDATKQPYSPLGTSKTSDDLKNPNTIANANWDLDNIWRVRYSVNDGYPTFQTEGAFVNSSPAVSSSAILGDAVALSILEASYTYSDPDYDAESGTTYQWYRSDDASGTNKQAILGATAQTYATVADDFSKYLNVEITANDHYSTGNTIPTAWLGPFDIPFSGGDGSAGNPFQIRTAQELQNIERKLDGHYVLGSNVDASETQTWNGGLGFDPIGNPDDPFVGTLNGQGFIIDSLYINRTEDYVGLFGVTGNVVNVKIEQVGLTNVDITGRSIVGGLAGSTSELITNTFVTGSVTATADTVGGLVGINNTGGFKEKIISFSYSTATVTGSSSVGGLVGINLVNFFNPVTVKESFWDTETSGQSTSGAGIGKTTNEMKDFSTFTSAGWDFASTWYQRPADNNGYPFFVPPQAIPGSAPSVSNARIEGAELGVEANLRYTFTDAEVDADISTFQWYTAEDSIGTNKKAISGANDTLFFIDFADKFLGASVTPMDFQDTGAVVFTPFIFIKNSFDGGDGTFENPYQISNILQLQDMQKLRDKNYMLVDNIDASETRIWNSGEGFIPIEFSGTLNGNGFKIDSLFINRPAMDNQGLFGVLSGSTSNLGLENASILGKVNVGAIAGSSPTGLITDSYSTGELNGSSRIGGLAGFNSGTIRRSYSNAHVSGQTGLGGLVGESNGGSIANSYARGNVTGDSNLGGFVGVILSSNIEYSYSTGNVTGDSRLGGFVGTIAFYGITNSFWDKGSSGLSNGWGNAIMVSPNPDLGRGYAHWDYNVVWGIDANVNDGWPFLQEAKANRYTIFGNEGWRMLASPVSGASFSTLLDGLWTQGFTGASTTSGSSNLYFWNEPTQSFVAPTSASQVPNPGQGFIMYMFADDDADGNPEGFPKSLSNSGTQHSGQFAPTLSFTDTDSIEADGWNLVGNPYGTTINWNAPSGWSKAKLDQTIYVWSDSAGGGAGAYKSWNGTTGTLGSGLIAPWQGFWVKANAAAPTIAFNDSVRNIGGVFLKKAPIPEIRFTMDNGKWTSDAIISFQQGAQIGKDRYDSYKLGSLNTEYLSLFTQLEDGTGLDINALPAKIEESRYVGLGFDGSNLSGSYELKWNSVHLPENLEIKLIDNESGTEVELTKASSYSFELEDKAKNIPNTAMIAPQHKVFSPKVVKAKSTKTRFTIILNSKTSVGIDGLDDLPKQVELSQNYPNPFNPTTTIQYGVPETSEVTIEVFNMLGQKVAILINKESKTAGRYTIQFDAGNLASGLYLYRLKAGNTIIIKKLTLIK